MVSFLMKKANILKPLKSLKRLSQLIIQKLKFIIIYQYLTKNLGKNKKAIDILHRALNKPNMYSSNANLVINYIELNDFENAIKYLHQSIKIRPKSKDLYLKLAEIYFKLGQIDEAVKLSKEHFIILARRCTNL